MRHATVLLIPLLASLAGAAEPGPRGVPDLPPVAPRPSAFDPSLMVLDGVIGTFGSAPGSRGFEVIDVRAAGPGPVVVADADRWFILEWDLEPRSWQQRAFHEVNTTSSPGGGAIAAVRAGDVDGDGSAEIVVLLTSGFVETWDGRGLTIRSTTDLALTGVVDLELVDVDASPGREIVVLSDAGVSVFPSGGAVALWSVAGVTGTDLDAGGIDLDPALEVVVAGTEGIVIDSGSRAVEATYPAGFGRFLDVAEVDGDSLDEVAFIDVAGDVGVVDVDTMSEKWRLQFDDPPVGIECADRDADGIAEVVPLVAGRITIILDGGTGSSRGRLPGDGSGSWASMIGAFEMGPLGASCAVTSLFAFTINELGPRISTFDGPGTARALAAPGPLHAFAVGDVDADGDDEVLVASAHESACGVAVRLVDRDESTTIDVTPTTVSSRCTAHPRGLSLVQFDADPQLEHVAAVGGLWIGSGGEYIFVQDGVSQALETSWGATVAQATALLAADLDGDGVTEFVHASGVSGGTSGPFLHVRTGVIWPVTTWTSPDYSPAPDAAITDIRVDDVDLDTTKEIAFSVTRDGVHVIDALSHAPEWDLADASVTCLDVADVVGGGAPEILVGDETGALTAYDGLTHAEIFRQPLGLGALQAITTGDLDGDGLLEIAVTAFASGTTPPSVALVLSSIDRSVLWTSEPVAGTAGIGRSLQIVDSDGDGLMELAVGSETAIRFFEHGLASPDATAPSSPSQLTANPVSDGSCCPAITLEWPAASEDRSHPVSYEVHRSLVPGFTPDASTLVGITASHAFRDETAPADTALEYAVASLDAAGNRSAGVVRAPAIGGPSSAPLVAPTIVSVTDLDLCAGGLEIVFDPPTPPPNVTFSLILNGFTVLQTGITSPAFWVPPRDGVYDFRVRASRIDCALAVDSPLVLREDVGQTLRAPIITGIVNDDPCVQSGFDLRFTAGAISGPGHHELLMDGIVVVNPATSPVTIPGMTLATHEWTVMLVDHGCARVIESSPRVFTDAERPLAAPYLRRVIDDDLCAASTLSLDVIHSFGASIGHYELWRDGALMLSPVIDGQAFRAPDGARHSYVVRAVDETCGFVADSAEVLAVDSAECSGEPLEVSLRIQRESGGSDRLTWLPPTGVVSWYDAYVGTLDSLWSARAYDHVASRPGLSFPDGQASSQGCAMAFGQAIAARVDGLPANSYVLVVAVAPGGAVGPYGHRSDGIDRHDPTVDPRPVGDFCR